MNIITSSQIQKNISIFSKNEGVYTVINRGTPRKIIIPYIVWAEELLEDFLEDLEILKNKQKLTKKWQESLDSWLSDLTI